MGGDDFTSRIVAIGEGIEFQHGTGFGHLDTAAGGVVGVVVLGDDLVVETVFDASEEIAVGFVGEGFGGAVGDGGGSARIEMGIEGGGFAGWDYGKQFIHSGLSYERV